MTHRSALDKLKKLEKAYKEGRISEETYKELKAKIERELAEKEERRVVEGEFSIVDHIKRLKKEGLMVPATIQHPDPHKPRKWKKKKWDRREYVLGISSSIIKGGFSYFRYKGGPQKGEVEVGRILKERKEIDTREKVPVLMEDESLEEVCLVRKGSSFEWFQGMLYFTGRRFIFNTYAFKATDESMMIDVIPTLTMESLWIKPDFSGILSLLGLQCIMDEGIIRKKPYDSLALEVVGLKGILEKSLVVQYNYLGSSIKSMPWYIRHWVPPGESMSIGQFYEKIRGMVEKAKETKVEDLIAHAYACHNAEDVWIATSFIMGPRRMSELPYAYWSENPVLV